MSVTTDLVARRLINVEAGVSYSIPIPAFEVSQIAATYGANGIDATYGVDYSVILGDDFNTFRVVFTPALLAKITGNAQGNEVTVRRKTRATTDATPAVSSQTTFVSREFDRNAMRDAELDEELGRTLQFGPQYANNVPQLRIQELQPGRTFMVSEDGLSIIPGPTVDQIELAASGAVDVTRAVLFDRRVILTTLNQRRYVNDVNGRALDLTQQNHVLYGGSPYGPLTYGVDYDVTSGGFNLRFDPLANELFHVISIPRFTNSEAQFLLNEYKDGVVADLTAQADRAEDAADRAEAATPFDTYAAFIAAEVPGDVNVVSFIAGDVVVKLRRKAGAPIVHTDTSRWEPADAFYSPLHFGALGDGVTNDGPAINTAMAAYKAKVEAVVGASGSLDFDFCGRVYVTTVSLNFTGLTSWGWGVKNGTIIGRCTGKAVADFIGSRGGRIADFVVFGDRAFPPSVGIQAARGVGGQDGFCDNITMDHVMTRGFFGTVGAWFYGQETTTYLHCAFWNENPLGACGFHVGTDAFEYNGVNPMLMQSDYLAPITGETSYINNEYINCDWRFLPSLGIYNGNALVRGATTQFTLAFPPANFTVGQRVLFMSEEYQTAAYGDEGIITAISGNTITVSIDSSGWAVYAGQTFSIVGAQTGPSVVFGRGNDHNFSACYIVSYGDYAMDIVFGTGGDVMLKINLDFLFEGLGPGYFRFRNVRPGLGIASGAITMYQVRCRDHCIAATGADPVRLHDMHISAPSARHRTPLIFDAPAKYQIVGGRVYTYQTDRLPRNGWAALRTTVADRQSNLWIAYGMGTGDTLTSRQTADGNPSFTHQFVDSLGVVSGFYQYSHATDAFTWSLDGLTAAYIMQDAAFYANDDNLTDLGIGARSWRRVYGQTFYSGGVNGKSGTFTTVDGKTITVAGGIITNIV